MANNPSQALNLGGQPNAYGDAFSVIDLMHGADEWIMQGTNGEEIRGAAPLDAQGWPTAFPTLNGEAQSIWTNVFYTKIMPAGYYIVEWEGEGNLTVNGDVEALGSNKYRVYFDADYSGSDGQDGVTIGIEASDPENTGGNIRNIKVYQEKYSDLMAMGEHFDPEWFQAIDDFRVLRTHDWQGTNFSKVTDWSNNDVTADQAAWAPPGRGMPYELLVEVANQARSDLWINIPHMATDQYMREAAAYVKANLDPDLRVYVEYTNEYWTDIFDQHPYLNAKGVELFGDAPFSNAQAYGARASAMTQIFKQVFGADQARLFPTVTLNHNAFNTAEAITMLTTPAYVAQGGISPLDAGIKFLGTDGYLSWFNTAPEVDAMVDGWMTERDGGFGSARDFLLAQLKNDLAPAWAKGRLLADQYDIQLGIYEGGALLLNGVDYSKPVNEKYTNFNEAVQLSAEMRQVYEAELKAWEKVGSGPFAWYSDAGRWGPWGDYGLWNAPDFKPEKRTEAIIAANQKTEPWWTGDTRPASTFENGKYDAGSAIADVMKGTALADRLYGLAGNDKLAGFAGDDILVGGAGEDKLFGGKGKDILVGGAGADILNGGSGFDFASYQTSTTAISLDMQKTKLATGDAKGDQLKSIEGLIGGSADDVLSGNNKINWIDGGNGNDTLSGRGGDDRLKGGAGDDIMAGGTGNDVFYFSAGKDKVIDWKEGDHIAVSTNDWNFGDPTNVQIMQVGADTKLTLVQGTATWELTLQNVTATTITLADDFLMT